MREYTIASGNVTVAGTTSLIYIKASGAVSTNLEFLRHWYGQSSSTTSAQLRIQLALNSGTVVCTGFTPTKLKEQDGVSNIVSGNSGAAGTCGINTATESGNRTVVLEDVFNVLNGWLNIPTPAETHIQPVGATSGYVMFLPVAPSPLTGITFGLNFREV